jgi:hypothetical protein
MSSGESSSYRSFEGPTVRWWQGGEVAQQRVTGGQHVGSKDGGGGRRAKLDDIARSLGGEEDTHAFYMSARLVVR